MSNFLHIFFIAMIVPLHGQSLNETIRWDVLETIDGGPEFLKENEHFSNQEIPDTTPQSWDTFDFIVIGGGNGGATIAARLSEIPQLQVLLIEAGGNENLLMDIPLLNNAQVLNESIKWNYQSEVSDKFCLGMKDRRCTCVRGKVIGGSSVLSYMLAMRGNEEDYNHWEEMGNKGWAYKDVFEYFKKLETMDIPELRSDTANHGTKGPVHISSPKFRTPYVGKFLAAAKEMGFTVEDYNDKYTVGFSYLQSMTKDGTRMSSNRAYLHPASGRKNLRVTYDSMVNRILIDADTKQAYGVEFTKNGEIICVLASKEVILSAGAIGSPQLLMLSGIGPAEQLNKYDIKVIRDAPVGKNMVDRVGFPGLTWVTNTSSGFQLSEDLKPPYPYLKEFLTDRSGPYAVPGMCEAFGLINAKHSDKRDGLPDIELLFMGGTKADPLFSQVINLNDTIRQTWRQYVGRHAWSIVPILIKMKSRGRILLRANDINVNPEIISNLFDDPEDIETLIAGVKMAIKIGSEMQVRDSQLLRDDSHPPGCEKHEYNSDDYWECAIRTLGSVFFHAAGTCKMGCKNDPTAIVDPELKVIGIQGLRIADASIIPEIPTAHANIPVYMIAEKAADMIKNDWGC